MLAPGFFGKIPGRGDFISRRVPPAIQQAWETWLASLVVAARQALGAEWPDAWLTAPLWHFSLGAALVPPAGAVGVLVASVDRVDRYFPFSIIAAATPDGWDGATLGWSRAAEDLMLGALDDNADPDTLDAALVRLGPPPLSSSPGHRSGQWPLELDGDWPVPDPDPLSERSRVPPGPEQSVWWCRGSGRMAPLHVRCVGLPGPLTTEAMVTGAFEFPDG